MTEATVDSYTEENYRELIREVQQTVVGFFYRTFSKMLVNDIKYMPNCTEGRPGLHVLDQIFVYPDFYVTNSATGDVSYLGISIEIADIVSATLLEPEDIEIKIVYSGDKGGGIRKIIELMVSQYYKNYEEHIAKK
uniref:Uncharacterized protein n=1 Tax=viral metagenome TaxID=1070528 RepID=A0A6M3L8W9_9ZZZZ